MRVWELDERVMRQMTVISLVLVGIGGLGHTLAWWVGTGGVSLEIRPWPVVLGVLLMVLGGLALATVHELVHGVVMKFFGASPEYGRASQGGVGYLYATAPGHLFSRWQYLVVALAPVVLLGGALLVWTAIGPYSGWVVLPATVHLAGCSGDLLIAWVVSKQSGATLVEDRRDGAAFHDPEVVP